MYIIRDLPGADFSVELERPETFMSSSKKDLSFDCVELPLVEGLRSDLPLPAGTMTWKVVCWGMPTVGSPSSSSSTMAGPFVDLNT